MQRDEAAGMGCQSRQGAGAVRPGLSVAGAAAHCPMSVPTIPAAHLSNVSAAAVSAGDAKQALVASLGHSQLVRVAPRSRLPEALLLWGQRAQPTRAAALPQEASRLARLLQPLRKRAGAALLLRRCSRQKLRSYPLPPLRLPEHRRPLPCGDGAQQPASPLLFQLARQARQLPCFDGGVTEPLQVR